MTEATQTNGSSSNGAPFIGPSQAQIDEMPSCAKLAQLLGVSMRTINRLASSGEVDRHRGSDGVYRFDADEVRQALHLETDSKERTAGTKVVLDGSNDVLRAALALLQQAHAHIDRLQTPAQVTLELLQNENRRLAEAAAEHHRLHLELVKAKEESLSEAHMRELETKRLDREEQRKGEIFKGLAKVAPRLLNQLKIGPELAPAAEPVTAPVATPGTLDPDQQTQVEAAIKLLNSMNRFQFEGLLETGFVDDYQAGLIRTILNRAPTTVPPAPAADEMPGDDEN